MDEAFPKYRFKKIKLTGESDDQLELKYAELNKAGDYDDVKRTCKDKPHPDLYKALDALVEHVVDMCELPDTDGEKLRIEVKSVSITWKYETMGAVITAQRRLNDSLSPMNINTPHKTENFYADSGDDRQLLSDDAIVDLKILIKEAREYLEGKRAQGDLFDGDEPTIEISSSVSDKTVKTTPSKLREVANA